MKVINPRLMKFHRLPVTVGSAVVAALLFGGCGKDEAPAESRTTPKAESSSPAPAAVADESTTSAAATAGDPAGVSAGQLDFYTERYISAEERLERRQLRIEEVISGGTPAGPG